MSNKKESVAKKIFKIEIGDEIKKGYVYAPSSINAPCSNTVMFVTLAYIDKWEKLLDVQNCLIFWPEEIPVPDELINMHFFVPCDKPRLEFARFFKKNNLYDLTLDKIYNMNLERFNGKNITIMPDAYIGEGVSIGNNTYIGSGVRLMGKIHIGNNVVIRENSVLGVDGLSFEREEDDTIIPIPQFGGIEIGDDVIIGANVVIARGAIDNTIISDGCMIDNGCFISHNVIVEENVAIVGESILFGSCQVGKNSFISGNVTIRDCRKIGEDVFIGMGSVVTDHIEKGHTVCGNPAKVINR